MNGAELLCESLRASGIGFFVGIPGTDNTDVYDICEKYGIRPIVVRNEMFAPMVADGYARVSRKPGVVLSIPGPGALALLPGLLEAYGSSVPVLAIVTDIPREYLDAGRGHLHEVFELDCAFRSVTYKCISVRCARFIPNAVRDLLYEMQYSKCRTAILHIPTDVYREEGGDCECSSLPKHEGVPDVRSAVATIDQAERPVIFAGAGVWWSDAMEQLRIFAEKLKAPVFTSVKGKGVISDAHPCGYGQLSGEPEFKERIAESDLGIIIGHRQSQRSMDKWTVPLPKKTLEINICPGSFIATECLASDAQTTLHAINTAIKTRTDGAWLDSFWLAQGRMIGRLMQDQGYGFEMDLLRRLRDVIPNNAIVVCDSAVITYWMRRYFTVTHPGTFLWPMGSGTIGWALPGALGAKLATQMDGTNRPVVAIVGDGGFQCSTQELGTMMQEKLPVVIVLFDDSSYGVIKHFQKKRYGRDTGATALKNPYFSEIAGAYSMLYKYVMSVNDLESAIQTAIESGQPALIHTCMRIRPPEGM